ncbi:hypothetical protein L1987_35918 [Smallanthus sonchifolius]|uniref:Uncharacterized protein n=1 Tax=Smallanthus sonchifolius TaxID=185202 RepID=A0ACB9HDF9_9ASTR|nr:hypothetical protein L1987_35918 [Smallanthus sonchifolius]
MVSGYLKKGDVEEGRAVFYRIKVRNLVNWNSLISGYCQNGLCNEALDAFVKMQSDGLEPDEVSFASALSACAQLGSLEIGKLWSSLIKWRNLVWIRMKSLFSRFYLLVHIQGLFKMG